MKNKRWISFLTLLMVSVFTVSSVLQVSAESETYQSPDEYDWIIGPASVTLDGKATLKVPESHSFLDKANTQRSILNSGGKPNGNEIGSLTSNSEYGSWYVVFEYVKTGHIHDDDQNLNGEELLSSYIRGTEEENRELDPEYRTYITGWEIEPAYDKTKHQLVYSLGFKNADQQAMVNYNVKLLTREGYITAILVIDTANFQQSSQAFEETVLNQLHINAGHTYEEYNASTDKTSTIGLNSLLMGGIGYTASQKFSAFLLLKKGWALILVVVLGLIGWIRYKIKSSHGDEEKLSPSERTYLQEADEQQHADQNELSYYRQSGHHSNADTSEKL